MTDIKRITFECPQELAERIDNISKDLTISKSALLRLAVQRLDAKDIQGDRI